MKKMTWALLSLMLFLGLGTAFAQDDPGFGGGGGGDVTITVPTLKPASGVVKPGATIDGTFPDEFNEGIVSNMESTGGTAFVLYAYDKTTTLETSMDVLGQLMSELMSGDEEEMAIAEGGDEELPYQIAVYCVDRDAMEDFDGTDFTSLMKWYTSITIPEDADGDVALRARVAVMFKDDIKYSEEFTADYTTVPEIVLAPMVDGMVGKNAPVTVHINDGTVNPGTGGTLYVDFMKPITVYYTTDGTTEPTKEKYEAQSDKVNGAIKKVETPYEEEDGEIYVAGEATVMFASDVHLKAIGYFESEEGEEVETSLFDQELTLKSEVNPTFISDDEEVETGAEFKLGDKLLIKNPNPSEDEYDGTMIYFSFDGTIPTSENYYSEEINGNSDVVFRNWGGLDIEMVFGQDETGVYAYSPSVYEVLYSKDLATFRPDASGKFAMQVYCESSVETGATNMMGRPEMMPYGSDVVAFEFTVVGVPETVTKPTFVPAPEAGNVAKGDAIKFEMDAACDEYPIGQSLVAVAYVIDGTDADLTIDKAKLETLMEEKAAGYTGYRQAGKVYLYEGEADAFPIEKTCAVKARQIVGLSYEVESEDPDAEPEVEIVFNLSEIVTANYTVDASKLAKPTIKTPKAGSTVEPNSPITFEMPSDYDWSAYTNLAYILYVENNETVKLEGTADDIIGAVPHTPSTDAKAGEPAYKVVECALLGDDLNWTKALIETESGALTIRARLAGITLNDEVFYSDEVTVSCTVAKGEGPGDDPVNPSLPATVKAPVFVPAAGEVEKGTAITWTWDEEAYNEETYPMVAVAYVVNGSDADLDITDENIGDLWNASQDEDANTVREEGVTYLYRTYDVDDAYPYHIEKASTVKARLIIGVLDETGEPAIALSAIVTAEYTIKGETPATVTLTFDPASGAEVEEGTAVAITASQDVEIFYMMFESEEAAKAAAWNQEEALSYSDELKPVPTKEKNTIKAAYALEGAEAVAEDFFYATYTVKELPAITLTFNPASGSEVEDNTTVTVTANRETEIFYNVYADEAAADADKETFMANAKEVKEDGMPVIKKGNTYLRCAVTDKGEMKYFNATYKIKEVADDVANEGLELSGVSVYPNPSNGLFNLELPVAATVEVFASNGMLMQRFNAAEGNATLNIERSGIYFLRITGEGRTTVKRLIVR